MKNKQVIILIGVFLIAIIPSVYYLKNEGGYLTGSVVEGSPIFYCSFDNTFECTNQQPIVNLHPSLESGFINQAVLVENGEKLIYNSKNNINSDKGTIELFYMPIKDTDVATILEDSETGNCGNLHFKLDTHNKISFNPKRGSRVNVISDTVLELNKWYHIAVTWDSDTETRLYINGKLESAQVFTFTPEEFGPQIRIGQACGSYYYRNAEGLIDELKIYDYVRTPEQILGSSNIEMSPRDINYIDCIDECAYNNACIPIGTRFGDSYCSLDKEIKTQKIEDSSCDNNYECTTNICINGACINPSIWQQFLESIYS